MIAIGGSIGTCFWGIETAASGDKSYQVANRATHEQVLDSLLALDLLLPLEVPLH